MTSRSHAIRGLILRRVPDTHVFSRATRGDAVAFAEVYRRFRPPVYAFCLARLLSRELAEDAAQETFTRVLTVNEPVRNPQAWLFSVARNVCIDVQRSRNREDARDPSEPVFVRDTSRDVSRDAADEAMAAWRARLVLLALRRLRPRYRTALILKEVHGLPVSDIADSLGLSTGATHTLITRARRSFARTYADVAGLPENCAGAVMLIFKRSASALPKAENERLESHLRTCETCRAEEQRLSRGMLAAALPMLVAQSGGLPGLLSQALLAPRPPLVSAIPPVQNAVQFGLPVVVACALLTNGGGALTLRTPMPLARVPEARASAAESTAALAQARYEQVPLPQARHRLATASAAADRQAGMPAPGAGVRVASAAAAGVSVPDGAGLPAPGTRGVPGDARRAARGASADAPGRADTSPARASASAAGRASSASRATNRRTAKPGRRKNAADTGLRKRGRGSDGRNDRPPKD